MRVERLARAQQRRLLVEGLARPRHERRGDAQRPAARRLDEVGRARDVPRRVAARLARRADAAVREARRVGLALHERLARELRDGAALAVGRQEAVVLGGAHARERVEDVRVVRRALGERPRLHRPRDDVGDLRVERRARVDRLLHRLEDFLRQHRLHRREAEDVDAEQRRSRRLLVVERSARVLVVRRCRDRRSPSRGSTHDDFLSSAGVKTTESMTYDF